MTKMYPYDTPLSIFLYENGLVKGLPSVLQKSKKKRLQLLSPVQSLDQNQKKHQSSQTFYQIFIIDTND